MEDPHDPHHARPRVLDAVNLLGRQVKARAGAERKRLAVDVRETLAGDDVAQLVVGVTVVGSTAWLDDPDELGRVHAAGVLVDEVAERALCVRSQLRTVGEANDHLARRPEGLLDRYGRRDDPQLARPWVVDRVGLPRTDVGGTLRVEVVGLTIQLERA